MLADQALAVAAAVTLPGLLAWLAARRWGLAGLMAALGLCAIMAVAGWNLTRAPLAGDAQSQQAGVIFLVIVPGVVSLILGAVAGFWQAHRRRLG